MFLKLKRLSKVIPMLVFHEFWDLRLQHIMCSLLYLLYPDKNCIFSFKNPFWNFKHMCNFHNVANHFFNDTLYSLLQSVEYSSFYFPLKILIDYTKFCLLKCSIFRLHIFFFFYLKSLQLNTSETKLFILKWLHTYKSESFDGYLYGMHKYRIDKKNT